MSQDVTIIGGGWSVANITLSKLAGIVIAVNDSAIYAPRFDFAVSMDRLWAENRIEQLERVVNSFAYMPEVWIRRNALQNLPRAAELPWLRSFECDHESSYFTEEIGRLNGTNSGACALNLAWKMKPDRVFLLGFDMTRDEKGRAYWYPPYPWSNQAGSTSRGKYDVWADQMNVAAMLFKRIDCRVFNVSPLSAITVFPKMNPTQYLRECA